MENVFWMNSLITEVTAGLAKMQTGEGRSRKFSEARRALSGAVIKAVVQR